MYGYFDTILMFLRYIWAAPDHFLLALPLNKKCCMLNIEMIDFSSANMVDLDKTKHAWQEYSEIYDLWQFFKQRLFLS